MLDRVRAEFPPQTHEIIRAAAGKLADYQDVRYANQYLDRLQPVLRADRADRDYLLTVETARYLALSMAYEDAIRVADLKIRSTRFDRVRKEVQAEQGQVVTWQEFMHPRVQELCDIMPAWERLPAHENPVIEEFHRPVLRTRQEDQRHQPVRLPVALPACRTAGHAPWDSAL